MNTIKISRRIVSGFFLLLLSACNPDIIDSEEMTSCVFSVEIVTDESLVQIDTRSEGIAKDVFEKKINNIYLFFFDEEGNKLVPLDSERYKSYIYREFYDYDKNTTALIVIPKNMFNNHQAAQSAKVYVVANVDKDAFNPEDIQNEKSLLEYNYCPAKEKDRRLEELPVDGMPMFGQCLDPEGNSLLNLTLENVPGSQATAQATAVLSALMARVDIELKIDSKEDDVVRNLPRLELLEWGLRNVPNGIQFKVSSESVTDISTVGSRMVNYPLSSIGNTIANGETWKSRIYIYENKQLPEKFLYPEMIDRQPGQKQRYKPRLANASACAFLCKGKYISYNEENQIANFTFYLGGNAVDDFRVIRNCHYKTSIAIHGIIANDKTADETNIAYDARVNIDDEENRYFIKMLREREHDSHFCVTPMDFYLLKPSLDPKMTVEIDKQCDWIRLEKVSAADMLNGILTSVSVDDHLNAGKLKEGHGKRKYFTTDLLTDPKQLKNNTSCTIGQNRDRVYLYVDENISRYDRKTHLKITYTDSQLSEPIVHYIEIGQYGLLEVRQMEDADDQYGTPSSKYFYIEHTEEYLNAYDPLTVYTSSALYDGLPYGYSGQYVSERSSRGYILTPSFNIKGYNMGLRISHDIYERLNPVKPKMDLNLKPQNAVLYCYAKNKTDLTGTIVGITPTTSEETADKILYTGWALPGIRQLERAMMAYYNLFTDFQGNYYWSATPGNWKSWYENQLNEDPTKSRATKYVGIGAHYASDLGYLESDYSKPHEGYSYDMGFFQNPVFYEGGGGWASRDKVFRVRAIYYYHGGERLPF